jgi:K+-sensing histidine kinase KdpD
MVLRKTEDDSGGGTASKSAGKTNASSRARKHKTMVVLVGCAVWLAALGWVDRATGYELGLFAFYTAPVGMVAWHLGRGPGVAVAFLASVVWYLADRFSGNRYSMAFYGYWNTGMHFGTFMINAVAIAKIKSSLDERHALERDLAEAHQRLQRLAGLIPLCPKCRKPHTAGPLQARAEDCLDLLPPGCAEAALCETCRRVDAPGPLETMKK